MVNSCLGQFRDILIIGHGCRVLRADVQQARGLFESNPFFLVLGDSILLDFAEKVVYTPRNFKHEEIIMKDDVSVRSSVGILENSVARIFSFFIGAVLLGVSYGATAGHSEIRIKQGIKIENTTIHVAVLCSNKTTGSLNYLAELRVSGPAHWTCVNTALPTVDATSGDVIEHRILGLAEDDETTPVIIQIWAALIDPISVQCENRTDGSKVNAILNPADNTEWICDGLSKNTNDYLRITVVATYEP